MQQCLLSWAKQIAALLAKDLKIEMRTRYAVGIGLGFCITSFLLVSIISAHVELSRAGYSVMFWLIVSFASSVNIPIAFTREEDKRTAAMLRLLASPSSVFIAKWLHSATFTSIISLLLLALSAVMWDWSSATWEGIIALVAVVIFVSLGLTASETLLAAMIARAKMRSSLMGVIAFPIVLPILIPAVKCTISCLTQGNVNAAYILWFIIYIALALSLSLPLFEHIWRC
ncbi:MAG: heme exporter protein CcmB [Armatimonadota bacterium]|nr:heme exporter protein CcmB [Armatimonadota bacterium]MCX7778111.1 heme exporter protein CcmB [Armatimonadota bacterium]MDW8026172.1 heme exporter protein CcmB [Armatimonadota bacterium]